MHFANLKMRQLGFDEITYISKVKCMLFLFESTIAPYGLPVAAAYSPGLRPAVSLWPCAASP